MVHVVKPQPPKYRFTLKWKKQLCLFVDTSKKRYSAVVAIATFEHAPSSKKFVTKQAVFSLGFFSFLETMKDFENTPRPAG